MVKKSYFERNSRNSVREKKRVVADCLVKVITALYLIRNLRQFVTWKIAASLTHNPNWNSLHRLSTSSSEQEIIFESWKIGRLKVSVKKLDNISHTTETNKKTFKKLL